MVTAYHLDGSDLVLTHYCIANNQPVLRAERFDPKPARFSSSSCAPRTCRARRRPHAPREVPAPGRRHFTTEWEFFEAGALKMTEVETFTRVR